MHRVHAALQTSSPYYGGVIATLKTHTHINTLADLPDQRISAESIYSLGGCLLQAQLMFISGYSFLNEPSQIAFTRSIDDALQNVMQNKSEVAFVRSGVLESSHASGAINITDWKLIRPVTHILDDGNFPYLVSTQIVPEWSLSALQSLRLDVSVSICVAGRLLTAVFDIACACGGGRSNPDRTKQYRSQGGAIQRLATFTRHVLAQSRRGLLG